MKSWGSMSPCERPKTVARVSQYKPQLDCYTIKMAFYLAQRKQGNESCNMLQGDAPFQASGYVVDRFADFANLTLPLGTLSVVIS